MDSSQKIEFLWNVLDREEQLIRAADQKLSFLLVLTTAALSGSAAVMSGKFAMPARIAEPVLFGGLLGLIVSSGAVSLLLGLAVLIPRTWRKRETGVPGGSLIFFHDIHRLPGGGYCNALSSLDEEQLIRDFSSQIESLADIAVAKMRYIRWLTICAGIEIIGLSGILALLLVSY